MISNTTDIDDNLRGQSIDQSAVKVGNHPPRLTTHRANVQRSSRGTSGIRALFLRALCWFGCALSMPAQAEESWFIIPEPKFMGHKVSQPIAGAKSTVLAVARMGTFGLDFPSADEWKNAGVTDDALLANTRSFSAKWLAELKPELVRNAKKVVEYARLSSDKVPVCAAVLGPEFLRQYEDIFGPKPLVVMPNRNTVFIFPGQAGQHERFASVVLRAWHSEAPRVSLEVFELSLTGLKAVGVFEE